MGNRKEQKRSFTLIELMITIIIIGIISVFTIRGFQKTIQGAKEKEAKINLLAIKAGQEIHHTNHGVYLPPGNPSQNQACGVIGLFAIVGHINCYLGLNIVENSDSVTYFCSNGNGYTCTAAYLKNGTLQWYYQIQRTWDVPVCTDGAVQCL